MLVPVLVVISLIPGFLSKQEAVQAVVDAHLARWTHLCRYQWPDYAELRIFLPSLVERLSQLIEQANAGYGSCSIAVEKMVSSRHLPPLEGEAMDEAKEATGYIWVTDCAIPDGSETWPVCTGSHHAPGGRAPSNVISCILLCG